MEKIKVLLIDDHSLFRRGLKSLLEDEAGFAVVGECDNGIDGEEAALELKPDVVLLDLDMSPQNGLTTLEHIKARNSQQCVLILTVSESDEQLQQCLKSGAAGYLLKNIDIEFLIYGIKSALKGNNILSPEMTTILLDRLNVTKNNSQGTEPPEQKSRDLSTLTSRERDILSLIADGLANKEIARKLNLTESTVKAHVQNILKKLNLHSRVQAAVVAHNLL